MKNADIEVKNEPLTEEKDVKIIRYKWLEEAIILGVPTRELTSDEYELYKEKIQLSESAMNVKIYELVEE